MGVELMSIRMGSKLYDVVQVVLKGESGRGKSRMGIIGV
jgi:hypothetical protein